MHKLGMATLLFFVIFGVSISACSGSSNITVSSLAQSKVSSLLIQQISLRQAQIASPTSDRLAQMHAQGMHTENLDIQRVYIYVKQQLTPSKTSELQALGITVYPDSWIPPVGNNPNGFYLADLPLDKLESLAAKDYVVRLDTAEQMSQPQPNFGTGD
jgi:hypothetical protein